MSVNDRIMVMTHLATKRFCRILLGAVLVFALQVATSAVASASCGDYLRHRSFGPNSSANHTNTFDSSNTDESRRPNPSVPLTPCRGVNCSKQVPLPPANPLKVYWQHQDQWCFLAVSLIGDGFSASNSWPPDRTDCRPQQTSFRLDRPPQLG